VPARPDGLSRRSLNRTLLSRQHLLERARSTAADEIEHLVGLQAQAPLAPYVALWSRLEGFDPAELSGLIERREAVRAVGMLRTTIHLLTARDALALAPVMRAVWRTAFRKSPFRPHLEGIDLEELAAAGRALLDEQPLRPIDLGRRLQARWPGRDPASLTIGVRDLTPIVQVPPRGIWGTSAAPTMAVLETWLGRPIDESDDPLPFVRRYLRAFGPASTQDVATWSWLQGVRGLLDRLRPELRTYRDEEGRDLVDLADGVITDEATAAPPRFLPEYDNLLLSHRDRRRVLDRPLSALPLPAGNGARVGTFLVDGFVAGTWTAVREPARGPSRIRLELVSWRSLTPAELAGLEAQGLALLGLLAPELSGEVVLIPEP
jgi:hypothetical protein